jgi:hypothetical protein
VPALVGPLLGFALGVALAWAARRGAPRESDALLGPPTQVAALMGCLVYGPACAYFLAFATDWSLSYAVDSGAVPSAVLLVLALIDAVAVPAGFQAGHRAAKRRAVRWHVPLGLVPVGIAMGMLATSQRALRLDGTFQQVSSAFGTRPVVGGPLGYAITWMAAMVGAGAVIAARYLTATTRQAQPEPTPGDRPAVPRGFDRR